MVGLLLLLVIAAWVEPERPEQLARERAARLAARSSAEAALAALPVPVGRDGVAEISFNNLSFFPQTDSGDQSPTARGFARQAPSRIKAFDRKRVRISGYMLPTRSVRGKADEFLILANQMTCCYGSVPRFCDFIVARMQKGSVTTLMDLPVNFEGTLHVGDVYLNGVWSALYSMDCIKVTQ